MPRPRKAHRVPKTSVSISVDLWEILLKKKPTRDTMDQYLNEIVKGYYYLKENYDFLEQVYEETSKKNGDYVRRIKDLERELGNRVEPARGVAATFNQSTERIQEEVIQ
jgi:hypothetical protein